MASTVNATNSGIVVTGDTSGELNLQVGGSNAIEIGAGGSTTISNATITSLTISNPSTFPAGSASAPAITTTGDTNTGVYFPAADEVAVTAGGTVAAAFNSNGLFFRNRIINGDMRIDQRNAGAAVTVNSTSSTYTVDRFTCVGQPADGVFTAQQVSDAPAGFVNSLKITVTTADASIGASELYDLQQMVEGTNVADLAFGTASAQTVTISFWVKSSVTGTFGAVISNSAQNRVYPFSYAINSADTWEKKSVTIAGDTTGTWLTTTGIGLRLRISLGAGSNFLGTAGAWTTTTFTGVTGQTNLISTLNATFFITGVQLETGSVATPFERRPYGTELMLCQRYYYKIAPGATLKLLGTTGYAASATSFRLLGNFPVPMRVAPSALETTGTAGDYQIVIGVTGFNPTALSHTSLTSNFYWMVDLTSSGMTGADAGHVRTIDAGAYLGWSAELL